MRAWQTATHALDTASGPIPVTVVLVPSRAYSPLGKRWKLEKCLQRDTNAKLNPLTLAAIAPATVWGLLTLETVSSASFFVYFCGGRRGGERDGGNGESTGK